MNAFLSVIILVEQQGFSPKFPNIMENYLVNKRSLTLTVNRSFIFKFKGKKCLFYGTNGPINQPFFNREQTFPMQKKKAFEFHQLLRTEINSTQ